MTIRILELRSALGVGGGPEKTILQGAADADPDRFDVQVAYIRDLRDRDFDLDQRATSLGVELVQVSERNSFDPRVLPRLYRLIRKRNIQIVHAHDYKTDLLVLPLCRLCRVIPLSTAHGWAGQSRKEQLYYRADKWILARYPLVIAVSEKIRSELLGKGAKPERVRVIRNGIDSEYFRVEPGIGRRLRRAEGIPDDATVIGAVGRLSPEKRFDLLIEIAARLGVFAVLVGEGGERAALERQARELGIADRVKLLGYRRDVRECHQIFDVYVQTSDTEGIPNAVLEAMALELPLVATAVGGTPELISDRIHGLLVPAGDVDALVGAVQYTLENRENTAGRVHKARVRVEQEFSFTQRMRHVEQIYNELVEQFPTRGSAESGS